MKSKLLNISQMFDAPPGTDIALDALLASKHHSPLSSRNIPPLSEAAMKRLREMAAATGVRMVMHRPMAEVDNFLFLGRETEENQDELKLRHPKTRAGDSRSDKFYLMTSDFHASMQRLAQKPNLSMSLLLHIDSLGAFDVPLNHGRSAYVINGDFDGNVDLSQYLASRKRKKSDWKPRQHEHAARFNKQPTDSGVPSPLLVKLIGKL